VSSRGAPDGPVAALERRAARAEDLAAASWTGAGPLAFAAGLYRTQARMAACALRVERPLAGRLEEDLDRLLDGLHDLLGFAAERGPAVLAEHARARAREPPADARALAGLVEGRGGCGG